MFKTTTKIESFKQKVKNTFVLRCDMHWNRNFTICVLVSTWTVVQITCQFGWSTLAYYFYYCEIRPKHYDTILLYLTYFYRSKCGDIELSDNYTLLTSFFQKPENASANEFYEVITAVLERASLPIEANAAARTNIYIHVVIIFNSMWALSAIAMFVGAFLKVKKGWSALCNWPWLILTAFSVLFDVVSAVHFGLDIRYIYNYSSWLRFIGVSNYKEFVEYDDLDYAKVIPTLPSTLICTLFSRFFIIWVLNILCFFSIMHIAAILYEDLKTNRAMKNSITQRSYRNRDYKSSRRKNNLNSSEARIRNWQQFYGVVGTNNSMNSTSSNDTRDYNLNDSTLLGAKHDQSDISFEKDPKSLDEILQNHRKPLTTIQSVNSLYYRRYSDVADALNDQTQVYTLSDMRPNNTHQLDVPGTSRGSNLGNSFLKNQLPWTYFEPLKEDLAKRRTFYCPDYVKQRNATMQIRANVERSTEM